MTVFNTIKTSAAGYKTVTHCVFDMDGLLLGNIMCTSDDRSQEIILLKFFFLFGVMMSDTKDSNVLKAECIDCVL